MNGLARKAAVVAAIAIAIGAPLAQWRLGFGQSASEFAEDGNETLRAAGYAFSIWTPIYIGMIAFAIYQLLRRNDGSRVVRLTAPYAIMAFAWCGVWILFSAWDQEWMTVGAIVIALLASLTGMRVAATIPEASRRDLLFCALPLAALAGWLTVATAVNVLTVLTAQDFVEAGTALPAALIGVAAVVVLAVFELKMTRLWSYALPVAWGLVAVFVAERVEKPLVAGGALAAAGTVLAAAWIYRRPIAAPR